LNSKNKKNIFKELLGYLVVAAIAAMISIGLRIFVIEPFIVPTPSMSPTLLVGDKVIVNKLEYKFKEIQLKVFDGNVWNEVQNEERKRKQGHKKTECNRTRMISQCTFGNSKYIQF